MGDRTFSAEDVIRIYEEHLTKSEQTTVDEFFMQVDESLLPLTAILNLLALLESLLEILSQSLLGALAATFGTVTLLVLNTAIQALRSTTLILGNILEREEVDA